MQRPEISIPVALATAAMTYAIYDLASPPHADVRVVTPGSKGDGMLARSERTALLTATGVAAAVSLIARDPLPFVLGAGFAVVLSWLHRTARVTDPNTGKIAASPQLTSSRYQVEAYG